MLPDNYEFTPEDYAILLELDESIDRSADKEAVAALPETEYNGKPGEQCVICFVDYEKGESVKTLPCSHIFHSECVDRWLGSYNKVCPLCKERIERNPSTAGETASGSADTSYTDAAGRSTSPSLSAWSAETDP